MGGTAWGGRGCVAKLKRRWGDLPRPALLALAYLLGSLPFSNLAAGRLHGVDLRTVGTGTVSGTGLYRVAGFRALAAVGCLDLAKGALAAAIGRRDGPGFQATTAGLALAGHNWSPLLRGAGGRGLAPALGATAVLAPEATAMLGAGLGVGKLLHQTGAGCFAATLALFPLLGATRGRRGVMMAAAVASPLLAKRLAGNGPPARRDARTYLRRLVLDRDA